MVPVLRFAGDGLAAWRPRIPRPALPAAATIAALGLIVAQGRPWQDDVAREQTLLAHVLRLAEPGESVLDAKGDAIFRPRAMPYVLEAVTKARLARGLLVDDIPEDLVATHTTVALAAPRDLPPRAREFVLAHYIRVGDLRVAGAHLETVGDAAAAFDVSIDGVYAIVGPHDPVTGWLDGTPYDGPRALAPGPHTFVASDGEPRHAVVWARAAGLGFTPFGSPPA
jgi:hypothetical protein